MKNYLMIISAENNIKCYLINSEQKELIEKITDIKDILAMNDIYISFFKLTKIKDLIKIKDEKNHLLSCSDPWGITNYKVNNNQKSIIDFLIKNYSDIFQEWDFSLNIT
jgi:hypothetical protein